MGIGCTACASCAAAGRSGSRHPTFVGVPCADEGTHLARSPRIMPRKATPLLDRMLLACKPFRTAVRGSTSGGTLMRFGTTPAPARIRRLAPAAALLGILTAFSPSDAAAAIALVQNVGSTGSGAAGTAIAVTVPAGGAMAGHTVIVTVALDPVAGAVSCSDSKGNTY